MRRSFVLLLVLAIACDGEKNRSPTAPDDVLFFSVSDTSVPASGFARVQLTAKIDPRSAAANRTITFRTTDGMLLGVGTSTEGGKKLDIIADATGVATAELQSSTNVGGATVTASVGTLVVRTVTIQFTAPAASDIIRISVSNTAPPADDATIVQVYADVAPGLVGEQRNVTFTTTAGIFIGGTTSVVVRADNRNRATADLKVPAQAVTARLTASVTGLLAEMTLTFLSALPDSLIINPSKVELKVSEEITVTANLRRVLGKVTPGRIVTFTAIANDGSVVGGFRNVNMSDEQQNATAVFSPGSTMYRGLVTIHATTPSASGTLLTAQTTVRLTD